MENTHIASRLDEVADLIELKGGNPFRVRSYRQAARTIRDFPQRIERLIESGQDITELPNVGESIEKKVREILDSGTFVKLEKLRKEVPPSLTELLRIPQVGPKRAKEIHDELGVDNIDDLKKAAEKHEISELEGMGPKTEEKISREVDKLSGSEERMLFPHAEAHVESVGAFLEGLDSIRKFEVAGSFRRKKETVGDLDILVEARDRKKAEEEITSYDEIVEVTGSGKEKISVILGDGLQIDFRFFETSNFGAAMLYFTGSKAHNIALRKKVVDHGWKLSEYGLFKGEKLLAGKTEKAVYKRMNMEWIPPELRENRGELEAAENGGLSELVELKHIMGNLHAHTKLTDGHNSIEEMAAAAADKGYQYLAITDHSKALAVTGGMDEDALRKQMEKVREVDDKFDRLWLMTGIEVDILKDGSLDFDEKLLAELDWVVASVHTNLGVGKKKMTERLLSAVRSEVVHCLGHPLERLIGGRDAIPLELEKIFEACGENGVALEINSQPDRLDLPDVYCREALGAGVRFSISTDAHSTDQFEYMRYGVNNARRGWLEKKDVINTKTAGQLKKELGR